MGTTAIASGTSLLLTVRNRICAVPIRFVVEIMRPQPVEPMAGTPPFVLGLAMVRGSPVPVLDVAAVLDGGPPGIAGRFVAARAGGRGYALAVDGVLGVEHLPADTFHELPSLLVPPGTAVPPGSDASVGTRVSVGTGVSAGIGASAGSGAFEGVGALDGQLCVLLAAGRFVPDEVWAAMDRRTASPAGSR